MAKNCLCDPPTARIDGGSWWQRRQQQQVVGRRQSMRRRRARRKEGVSCAAAGKRDRASAATGVWDRANSSGSSRCTHSVPCIHSPRTMHTFTADPWTEWHRTDMTMHIGKMPGDKTKRASEPPQNSQGGTRNTTSYLRELHALGGT